MLVKRMVVMALIVAVAAVGVGCWPQEGKMLEFRKDLVLMDTIIQIALYHEDPQFGQEALDMAVAEFERLTALSSRFPLEGRLSSKNSDILRINENAGVGPVTVDADTMAMIQQSIYYCERSAGSFDITIGPVMDLWGFGGEEQQVPTDAQLAAVLPLVDYRLIQVDPEQMTVYLPRRGMSLDLGGVAKGYATEKTAALLEELGIKHALINAGGNIYALGPKPNGNPWRIGIRDPRREVGYFGILSVSDLSLVTSGDYERYFEVDGVRYSHLIHPATGKQTRGIVQTTVASLSSTEADIVNKPLFLLGLEKGIEAAEQFDLAGTVSVTEEGEVHVTGIFAEKMEFIKSSGYRLVEH